MNAYSHVGSEVSCEAADRIADTLWQVNEDRAHEPDTAESGERQEDAE